MAQARRVLLQNAQTANNSSAAVNVEGLAWLVFQIEWSASPAGQGTVLIEAQQQGATSWVPLAALDVKDNITWKSEALTHSNNKGWMCAVGGWWFIRCTVTVTQGNVTVLGFLKPQGY